MADEEVKPVEEQVTETTKEPEPAQEELPLAAATEEPEKVEAADTADADKPAEPVKEEPKADWRDKELKAKHRRQKELERALEDERKASAAKDALLAKFNQDQTPATPPVDEVQRAARELVAQQNYIEECNKAAAKGEDTYKDGWKEAVANLELIGGFDMPTMNGVLATDDPAKVLYELGRNPDRYHSIMALPLERRIIEMGKIAMAQPTAKPVSNAPAPVNPVGGRAAPAKETLSDDMSDDKWYAIRDGQRLAKLERDRRRGLVR